MHNRAVINKLWYIAQYHLSLAEKLIDKYKNDQSMSVKELTGFFERSIPVDIRILEMTQVYAHLTSAACHLARISEEYGKLGETILQNYRSQLKNCTGDSVQMLFQKLSEKLDDYLIFLLRDNFQFKKSGEDYCSYYEALNMARKMILESMSISDLLAILAKTNGKIRKKLLRINILER